MAAPASPSVLGFLFVAPRNLTLRDDLPERLPIGTVAKGADLRQFMRGKGMPGAVRVDPLCRLGGDRSNEVVFANELPPIPFSSDLEPWLLLPNKYPQDVLNAAVAEEGEL